MCECYKGPGGVVITRDECEELLELLIANPRPWNHDLRDKLSKYLSSLNKS